MIVPYSIMWTGHNLTGIKHTVPTRFGQIHVESVPKLYNSPARIPGKSSGRSLPQSVATGGSKVLFPESNCNVGGGTGPLGPVSR